MAKPCRTSGITGSRDTGLTKLRYSESCNYFKSLVMSTVGLANRRRLLQGSLQHSVIVSPRKNQLRRACLFTFPLCFVAAIACCDLSSGVVDGLQQVSQADVAEHFRSDAVGDAVDELGAILRRVDVDTKRQGAEGLVDDIDDGGGNGGRIGIGRLKDSGRGGGCAPLRRFLGSDHAAIGAQDLAVDPGAVWADEEGDRGGDVFRRAEAFQRVHL